MSVIAAAAQPRSSFRMSQLEQRGIMFDSQCDLAALVYEQDQDPDETCAGLPAI
jgi:hypothetical protein